MLGPPKPRRLDRPVAVSLEDLVPREHFYRQQQPLQQVRPALVADVEAAAAEQPGERALNHPPMAAQPLAGVDPAAGDARGDVTSPERTPQVGRVGLQKWLAMVGRPF